MPDMKSSGEAYQPMTFDAIKIGLASPEKIRSWSHGEVKNRRQLTIEHSNRKKTVCSAKEFSDRARTGNVTAVNIKRSVIKA